MIFVNCDTFWYTILDPSPIIALTCLSLSWVSQFLLLLRLDWYDPGVWIFYSHVVDVRTKQNPCCWCRNKAKPMFSSIFIWPNQARWLPCLKASFARSVCNTNNFLHIDYIAFTQIKYTYYLLIPCLLWDLTDMTLAKIHATSPCLTLQNLAKPNQ